MIPILANDGRTIIGKAKTAESAKRMLSKQLEITRGFTLKVWMRDPLMVDINGGSIGFMYAIGK